MCDIIKDCRKAFDEKCNTYRNQLNELVEQYLVKLVHKNKNSACCDVNNMGSEAEVISCSNDKGKHVF